ncbi:MAG TPA: DUF1501 domain-containing protein [Gemmatales bacterium]|nr:DUF1501 domain-containing protein [Gemmatales bacterium]
MLLSRRDWLFRTANGIGALALADLLHHQASAEIHHPAKADHVIFLYMDGGPSQMDTFDPKPRLDREHGQPIQTRVAPTQFNDVGKVLKSPWKFRQYGQSGTPVSDLFPHVAQHVDDLCIIRSMTSNFSEHTNANYFFHTGHGQQGRPSMGAWCSYGLGSLSKNLPSFVVLNSGLIPPGGIDNFGNGFLSATHQASIFFPGPVPLANLQRSEPNLEMQKAKLELVNKLDRGVLSRLGNHPAFEAAIQNHELAFRMQSAVPEVLDISSESEATRKLYGLDSEYGGTQAFGRSCLLARRLIEKGVRFVEVTCPANKHDRWDQHANLKQGHEDNARAVDQPIAGLLTDLKSRGLLQRTLILWAGEFGRTPMAQGTNGRDHNPFGFSIWLAGGGIKPGTIYGQTDDYGYHAIENKVEIYDLHATMLHLLGIDHKRLTVRFGGRDMRLTDVHGEVLQGILA